MNVSLTVLIPLASFIAPVTVAAESLSRHRIFAFEGAPSERFGAALAPVGDLDGDGAPDFAIGAPRANGPYDRAGRVDLVSGATGIALATWRGDSPYDAFGTGLAGVGDVDGDGLPDIAVSSPTGSPAEGRVVLFFGGGTARWVRLGPAVGDRYGHAIAPIGDVNGDGFTDLAVGAPDHDGTAFGAGRCDVLSGADGALLRTVHGAAMLDRLGLDVAPAGDVDGDGVADIAVGAPLADISAFNGGAAFVISGATGEVLRTFAGTGVADQLGYCLDGGRDFDGDGTPDIGVGAPGADFGGLGAGRVELRSGADASLLVAVDGAAAGEELGSVASLGDIDGDDVPDFATGAPSATSSNHGGAGAGRVTLRSGADGAAIATISGPAAGAWFGHTVSGGGDIDGDGVDDILVGGPVHDDDLVTLGRVSLLSGRPRELVASGHALSISAGGVIDFEIASSPSMPLAFWVLLGSMSGTSPGVSVGGVHLPLAADDPYFMFRLAHPAAPPLFPGLGTLDSDGRAEASFALPAGLPGAWAGQTVHHAHLILPSGTTSAQSGPAAPITLMP